MTDKEMDDVEIPLNFDEDGVKQLYYYCTCVLQAISTPEEAAGYVAFLMRESMEQEELDELYSINVMMTEDAFYDCLNDPDIAHTVNVIQEIWDPVTLVPDIPEEQIDPELAQLLEGLENPNPPPSVF